MIHRNKKNLLAAETQEKLHYKMYKAGKQWLFAGLTLLTLGAGLGMTGLSAQASTDENVNSSSTDESNISSDSATVNSQSVVLKASVANNVGVSSVSSSNDQSTSTSSSTQTSVDNSSVSVSTAQQQQSNADTSKTTQSVSSESDSTKMAGAADASSAPSSTTQVSNADATGTSQNADSKSNSTSTESSVTTSTNSSSVKESAMDQSSSTVNASDHSEAKTTQSNDSTLNSDTSSGKQSDNSQTSSVATSLDNTSASVSQEGVQSQSAVGASNSTSVSTTGVMSDSAKPATESTQSATTNSSDNVNKLISQLPINAVVSAQNGKIIISGLQSDQLSAAKAIITAAALQQEVDIVRNDASENLNGLTINPDEVAGASYVTANDSDYQNGFNTAKSDTNLIGPSQFYGLGLWLTNASAGTSDVTGYLVQLATGEYFKKIDFSTMTTAQVQSFTAGYRFYMAEVYNEAMAYTKAILHDLPVANSTTSSTYYDDLANAFFTTANSAQSGSVKSNLTAVATLLMGFANSSSNTVLTPTKDADGSQIPVGPYLNAGDEVYKYVGYKASDDSYTFLKTETATGFDRIIDLTEVEPVITAVFVPYISLIADEATFNTIAKAFLSSISMNTLGLSPTQDTDAKSVYNAIANNLDVVSGELGMPLTISELVQQLPELHFGDQYDGGNPMSSDFRVIYGYTHLISSKGAVLYVAGVDKATGKPIIFDPGSGVDTTGYENNGLSVSLENLQKYGVPTQYGLFDQIYTSLRHSIVYSVAGAYATARNKYLQIIKDGDTGTNASAFEDLKNSLSTAPSFANTAETATSLADSVAKYQMAQLIALQTKAVTDSDTNAGSGVLMTQTAFDNWMESTDGQSLFASQVMTNSSDQDQIADSSASGYTAASNYASFSGATKQLYYDVYLSGLDKTKFSVVTVKFVGVDANDNPVTNADIAALNTKVPVQLAAVDDDAQGQPVNTTYLLGKDLLPNTPSGWSYATNSTAIKQNDALLVSKYSTSYLYTVKLIQTSQKTFTPVDEAGNAIGDSWTDSGVIGGAFDESSHVTISKGSDSYIVVDKSQLQGTFQNSADTVNVVYSLVPAKNVVYTFQAVDANGQNIVGTSNEPTSWTATGLTGTNYDVTNTIVSKLTGYTLKTGQTLSGSFGTADQTVKLVYGLNDETVTLTVTVPAGLKVSTAYYQVDGTSDTKSIALTNGDKDGQLTGSISGISYGQNVSVWLGSDVLSAGYEVSSKDSVQHLQLSDGLNALALVVVGASETVSVAVSNKPKNVSSFTYTVNDETSQSSNFPGSLSLKHGDVVVITPTAVDNVLPDVKLTSGSGTIVKTTDGKSFTYTVDGEASQAITIDYSNVFQAEASDAGK
ncbi:KxYKxGKxW signal peptide domain-containing protein, partial [Furfurilactobacillus rossiae]